MNKLNLYPKHGGKVAIKRVECPKNYYGNFLKFSRNIYSQNGEDGIIAEIFKRLDIAEGISCEFGAWDGKHLSNALALVEKGWSCLMIEPDKNKFNSLIQTAKQFPKIITGNDLIHYDKNQGTLLDEVLIKNNFKKDFDFLSIDIDSYDYQVWKSLNNFHPKVVIIEHSGLDMDIIYKPGGIHKRHLEGNTSFIPMKKLGEEKGYVLLCDTGNLIFLRKDLLEKI